jgi:fatty acid desaturase
VVVAPGQQHARSIPSLPAMQRGSEYAQLPRQIKQAGLLERRRGYLHLEDLGHRRAAGRRMGCLRRGGGSWWQPTVAVFLAVMFTQAGFLGHDAGRRQIFGSRRANYILGILFGNLGIGLNYGWWVGMHNRHHAHPNQEGADPDIWVGALAFTAAQARASRGAGRLAFRYQAYLFFPLLLLEAIGLHVASISALTSRAVRRRSWETPLLAAHAAGRTCAGRDAGALAGACRR